MRALKGTLQIKHMLKEQKGKSHINNYLGVQLRPDQASARVTQCPHECNSGRISLDSGPT